MEVAPLKKNLFFLAAMKLGVKDSFGYNEKPERMGKTFPTIYTITHKHCLADILLTETSPSMYLIVNLKMKKPTLCYCFTLIVFIERNFTVAFLLKR